MHSSPAHISQMPYQSTRTALRHLCAKQPSGWRQKAAITAAAPSAVIQWMWTRLSSDESPAHNTNPTTHKQRQAQGCILENGKIHPVGDVGRWVFFTCQAAGAVVREAGPLAFFCRRSNPRGSKQELWVAAIFQCRNSRLVSFATPAGTRPCYHVAQYNMTSSLAGSYNRAIWIQAVNRTIKNCKLILQRTVCF